MKPTRVVVHCSDTPDSILSPHYDTRPDTIRQWHIERGFKNIGYHWIITRDGCKHTGRHENMQGAHCKANGGNIKSIGICLVGRNVFTTRQIESLKNMYLDILYRHGIEWDMWFGHYEFDQSKSCPNMDMDQLRDKLRKL